MTIINLENYCKELIQAFIQDKNPQIEDNSQIKFLETYPFSKLQYNNDDLFKYGWQLRNPDCDDCEIAKAIMYLFYKKQGLELDGWIEDIHSKYSRKTIFLGSMKTPYRMDTMNSYNTLLKEKFKENTKKYEPYSEILDESIMKKVQSFYETFQTIGNFILLPNKPVGKYTINTYRAGIHKKSWRDYLDIFLYELKKCLDNNDECDKGLSELIYANDFYFNSSYFNNTDKFKKFCELNMISEFYKENHKDLFYYKGNYSYWDNNKDKYKDFVLEYIEYAETKIKNRSKKIR